MPDEIQVNSAKIRLMIGDVTDIETDAFVFYANSNLELGSGFGNAISMRGGPSISEELKQIKGDIPVGKAVISAAGEMKAEKIIHAVGPKFMEKNTAGKLRDTMMSALALADENGIKKLAFPAMGYGFYGVPLEVCADIMVSSIKEFAKDHNKIKEYIIVPLDRHQYKPFSEMLK